MKGFVEVIGFISGILSIIAGIVVIIFGLVLKENVWAYILYGCFSIISGVFWCGLILYVSEHEKRVTKMENILVILVRDKLEKKHSED